MKKLLFNVMLTATLCTMNNLYGIEAYKTTFKAAVNAKNAPLAIATWNMLDDAERKSLAGFQAKFQELGGEAAAKATLDFMQKVANAKTADDQKQALKYLFDNQEQPGRKVSEKLGLGNRVVKAISE